MLTVKQAENTCTKLAILIKEQFPTMTDQEAGQQAKEFYLKQMQNLTK